MSGFLRFLQLLSMTVWVGGLIFFAFVLAPTAFHVLPSFREAGLIVGASLKIFDWISLTCGAVFLVATALIFRAAPMRIRGRYELQLLVALVMFLGMGYLAWNIIPAMDNDQRLAGGDVNAVEPTNPARLHFEKLHVRSERTAGTVLILGLGVLFLMSRETARID
jgi:uncharacterized membrane protein